MTLTPHQTRLVTALALLPGLLFVIHAGGNWLFGALILVSCLGLWEFYSLFWTNSAKLGKGLGKKLIGMGFGAAFLAAARAEDPHLIVGVTLASFWFGNLFFLFWYGSRARHASYLNALILVGGLMYVPFTLHFFLFLSPVEVVLILLAAIASDTCAYYAGRNWGARLIWPSVSPKKTVEGSLGGLAACIASVSAVGLAAGSAPWWAWPLLGLLLGVAAQLGDFFESALKRWLAVKDSGSLLPGHGGILDRIDALLLVTPVYAAARLLMDFFPQP